VSPGPTSALVSNTLTSGARRAAYAAPTRANAFTFGAPPMTPIKLHGLVAATHTPFAADGDLNLAAVERQAEHLARAGVAAVFVGGTTGECSSLTVDERLALARRWGEVVRGSPLQLVVHVGSNCLADARGMAADAHAVGAVAVAALAPSYFKPASLDALVACCADVAAAAPGVPFYFYDIPSMTGVRFPMGDFLAVAPGRIPTLAGIKFTNPDLMAYQQCLHAGGGRFDVLWGSDEYLLAALALGATGAVGSTYNFAAPIYRRLTAALAANDLAAARAEQYKSVRLVALLAGLGYMAAAKAVMGFLGVDVGPARLPATNLTGEQLSHLRRSLDEMGFFEWVRA
jgi:N-acetylneuraminate lyase